MTAVMAVMVITVVTPVVVVPVGIVPAVIPAAPISMMPGRIPHREIVGVVIGAVVRVVPGTRVSVTIAEGKRPVTDRPVIAAAQVEVIERPVRINARIDIAYG
jgi:hypothetical protein